MSEKISAAQTASKISSRADLRRNECQNRHAPAGIQARGQLRRKVSSAENSSFTAMRNAWKTRRMERSQSTLFRRGSRRGWRGRGIGVAKVVPARAGRACGVWFIAYSTSNVASAAEFDFCRKAAASWPRCGLSAYQAAVKLTESRAFGSSICMEETPGRRELNRLR